MQLTQGGLYVPEGLNLKEYEARVALGRHYEAMNKLEHELPNLVKLSIQLANMMDQAVCQRGLAPEDVMMDTPKWHDTGVVFIRLGFDEGADRITRQDGKVSTFTTLKQINEKFPQVTEVALAMAFQLVKAINHWRVKPDAITFSKPRFKPDDSAFMFTVMLHGHAMARPATGI